MIDIKTIGVWGFEGALTGMRFPYESGAKSDSYIEGGFEMYYGENGGSTFIIEENDMALCKKLIKGGSEHRKFLRMIHVQAEVKAPRYWLTELDTYKIGTVRNSSSTMHLITKRELIRDDFSFDETIGDETIDYFLEAINCRIEACNMKGSDGLYVYSRDERERYFREIKQLLPESFMQKFVFDCNYEVLLNIYHQRHNHRLTEWRTFCEWITTLPYMEEFLEVMK